MPVRFEDLGIDEHHQRIPPLGHVHDDHLLVHVDLGGGEPDTRRRVHRFRHIGDQPSQALIENRDGRGDFVQSGIGVSENVQKRHLGQICLRIEWIMWRISGSV
ncbi:hypothetical protein D3C83_47770 [compost metagenome]